MNDCLRRQGTATGHDGVFLWDGRLAVLPNGADAATAAADGVEHSRLGAFPGAADALSLSCAELRQSILRELVQLCERW